MAIYKWSTEPKKIYVYTNETPITSAWIYHNEEMGIISLSSDGSNRITIADKNLGSTKVGIYADSLGNYFQWGNNYKFPNLWTVTTSSTQVNAQNYWPNNYYSSSTFIIQSTTDNSWDSSNNANLWGNTTGTNIARKWPCNTWFHVPSETEFTSLMTLLNSIVWGYSSNEIWKYLKIPLAWLRWPTNSNVSNQLAAARYRTTNTVWNRPRSMNCSSWGNLVAANNYKCSWCTIRPFSNVNVQPREWNERVRLYPQPLKSYAEIAAMQNAWTQDAEMLAELNTAPYEYYSSFSGTHIVNWTWSYAWIKLLSPDWVNMWSYWWWLIWYFPNDYPTAQYRNTWNIAW